MIRSTGKGGRSVRWALLGAALALSAVRPVPAGDTSFLIGAGYGPLRKPPRTAYTSLELDHTFGSGPFGYWVGLDVGGDEKYVAVGLLVERPVGRNWHVAISSGPGKYSNRRPLTLGNTLEFRSTLYVWHRLEHKTSVGFSVSHYSNAGTARHNPGAETVRVFLCIPVHLGRLFGHPSTSGR